MTTVGKILVFLNLVFSLVVGGFAVVDYTARTHWAKAYKDLNAMYAQSQQANDLLAKEAARVTRERDTLVAALIEKGAELKIIDKTNKEDIQNAVKRVVAWMENAAVENKNLTEKAKNLTRDVAAEKARNGELLASEKAYKLAMDSRQTDATQIRDALKTEVDKNFALQREKNEALDLRVQAEIKARTLDDYNRRLLARVTELEKLKASGGAIAGRANTAPPQDVEGLVRRAENNLVTISLGADNGLARGQMLEVFRMGQNARYIGKIRIVDVTPTQAVGQATGRLSVPIQVGDRVASRIMSNN